MRRISLLLAFVAVVAPGVFAADPEIKRIQHDIAVRMREAKRAARAQQSRIAPHVVKYEANEYEFVIPSAGSLAGAGGTFFRSDVSFVNFEAADQDVVITWLERGVDGRNAPQVLLTLPAESWVTYRDFVGNVLQRSGLGAIVVTAVDANGAAAEGVFIDGFSRIWTPQPGSTGSVSLSFEAVVPHHSLGNFYATAVGLRQDAAFRSNAGIVNLHDAPLTWTVYVSGSKADGEFDVTVPPLSMVQVPLSMGGSSDYGAVSVFFVPKDFDEAAGEGARWIAFGTTNDNVTGDGWVSRGIQ